MIIFTVVGWALGDADELVKLAVGLGAQVPFGALVGWLVSTKRRSPPGGYG